MLKNNAFLFSKIGENEVVKSILIYSSVQEYWFDFSKSLFTDSDGGLAVTVGIKMVQGIMFVYDFLTFPLYFAIQQPWKNTEAMASVRANPVNKTKTSVTYKPIDKTCPTLEAFKVRFSRKNT